jgi:hypothetical protein
MIRKLILFLFILSITNLYAQNLTSPLASIDSSSNCVITHQYNLKQRTANYLFNTYSKVYLVSFEVPKVDLEVIDPLNPKGQTFKKKIFTPTEMQKMDTSLFVSDIILNNAQIDSLTIILYNYGYKKNPKSVITFECEDYNHALLFLSNEDVIMEYVLFGFECEKVSKSIDKIDVGDFCSEKFNILKSYFSALGIDNYHH